MRCAEQVRSGFPWRTHKPNPVLLLGLGNILIQDEGVGVHVIERILQGYGIPPGVDVLDGGTAGFTLYDDIANRECLIVVDAVNNGCAPGTLVTLRNEEVPAFFRKKVSPHQLALSDVLAALEIMNEKPAQVMVIGVQPKDLGTGLQMSELISRRVDSLVHQVVDALARLGYQLTPIPSMSKGADA